MLNICFELKGGLKFTPFVLSFSAEPRPLVGPQPAALGILPQGQRLQGVHEEDAAADAR